jgi:hypothetical protein
MPNDLFLPAKVKSLPSAFPSVNNIRILLKTVGLGAKKTFPFTILKMVFLRPSGEFVLFAPYLTTQPAGKALMGL